MKNVVQIVLLDGSVMRPSMTIDFLHVDEWGVRVREKFDSNTVERTVWWREIRKVYVSMGRVRVLGTGETRILDGRAGQIVHLLRMTGIDDRCALVLDPSGLDQVWTLGPDEFELVEEANV